MAPVYHNERVRERCDHCNGTGHVCVETACVKCGKQVEDGREDYALPHCYACLAPPPLIPRVYGTNVVHVNFKKRKRLT